MAINRWWDEDSAEFYWLETTDRDDIGVDLNAPQRDDASRVNPRYALIREIDDGDVVFHYHKARAAIVAWSRAVGAVWEDEVVWGARGTSARNRGVVPYRRKGWRLGLEGPYDVSPLVTADDLARHADDLRRVRSDLRSKHRGSLYFPFELSAKRSPRATQSYLTKLPAGLVRVFPALHGATRGARSRRASVPDPTAILGLEYRRADEDSASTLRDPFSVDPALVDRGVRGHASTQNALADHVASLGLDPRSPSPSEPQFDLTWRDSDCLIIAEVKV